MKPGERVVQKMLHQHADGKTNGISLRRFQPFAHAGEQFGLVLPERFGGELVAGRPVVHIGQEPLHFRNASAVLPDLRTDEGVEMVLVEIPVR